MADTNFHVPKGRPSKKMPAPFQRPSIELDKTPREWRMLPAAYLVAGDTVADIGLLSSVVALETFMVVSNVFDEVFELFFNQEVYAFVEEN